MVEAGLEGSKLQPVLQACAGERQPESELGTQLFFLPTDAALRDMTSSESTTTTSNAANAAPKPQPMMGVQLSYMVAGGAAGGVSRTIVSVRVSRCDATSFLLIPCLPKQPLERLKIIQCVPVRLL